MASGWRRRGKAYGRPKRKEQIPRGWVNLEQWSRTLHLWVCKEFKWSGLRGNNGAWWRPWPKGAGICHLREQPFLSSSRFLPYENAGSNVPCVPLYETKTLKFYILSPDFKIMISNWQFFKQSMSQETHTCALNLTEGTGPHKGKQREAEVAEPTK